jgi:FlaA1/EpsC-like NDP-sugar epimerase
MLLAVLIMALGFWKGQLALPRSVIVLSIAVQAALLLGYRLTIKSLYERHNGPQRLLIVADTSESASGLAAKFAEHARSRFSVMALMQPTQDLNSLLQDVDAVAVSASVQEKRDLIEICTKAGKQVFIVPDGFELLLNTARPEAVDDVLIFAVRPSYLTPMQLLSKRVIDLIGSP